MSCEDYVNAEGVTASATSQNNGGSGADKAIDDDIMSRWESKKELIPEFNYRSGVSRNIKQISIVWENASASDYTIEVSEDGENFTTVAVIESMGAKQNRADTIVLSKMAKGRYVRINGTAEQQIMDIQFMTWQSMVQKTQK
ncbi:MAG: discoidin domain-containing protein [Eubacterium ventriosum]